MYHLTVARFKISNHVAVRKTSVSSRLVGLGPFIDNKEIHYNKISSKSFSLCKPMSMFSKLYIGHLTTHNTKFLTITQNLSKLFKNAIPSIYSKLVEATPFHGKVNPGTST